MAHEFGHGTGGLADEYCQPGTFAGGEPGAVNVTDQHEPRHPQVAAVRRAGHACPDRRQPDPGAGCTGWNGHRTGRLERPETPASSRAAARGLAATTARSSTAGCAGTRPRIARSATREMKSNAEPSAATASRRSTPETSTGTARTTSSSTTGTRSTSTAPNGAQLDVVFSAVERVPGSWQFKPGDQFYVGDFNGDGKDEVVVFNGTDWAIEYLGLLADDGADGLRLIARYDNSMPGWEFPPGDSSTSPTSTATGERTSSSSTARTGRSPTSGCCGRTARASRSCTLRRRHARLADAAGDRHIVGDFTGDGKEDLWVFNGSTGRSRTWACCGRTGRRCG